MGICRWDGEPKEQVIGIFGICVEGNCACVGGQKREQKQSFENGLELRSVIAAHYWEREVPYRPKMIDFKGSWNVNAPASGVMKAYNFPTFHGQSGKHMRKIAG